MLCAVASVLLLMPIVMGAQTDMPKVTKTSSFPAKQPLVSIGVPDGWTTPGASLAGAEFPLLIIPPNGLKGKTSLYLKEDVTDPHAALKKTLDYLRHVARGARGSGSRAHVARGQRTWLGVARGQV